MLTKEIYNKIYFFSLLWNIEIDGTLINVKDYQIKYQEKQN